MMISHRADILQKIRHRNEYEEFWSFFKSISVATLIPKIKLMMYIFYGVGSDFDLRYPPNVTNHKDDYDCFPAEIKEWVKQAKEGLETTRNGRQRLWVAKCVAELILYYYSKEKTGITKRADELRIGDWVNFEGTSSQIDEIVPHEFFYKMVSIRGVAPQPFYFFLNQ